MSGLRLAALPPAAQALRCEIKPFLAATLPPAPGPVRARSWMGFDAGFSRQLATRGWVGVTLPAAHGGAHPDAFSRHMPVEELLAVGAPASAHWIADRQSSPLILKFGADAQKAFYLPRIFRAEAFFCIGMTDEFDLGLPTRPLHDWRMAYGGEHHWNQRIDAQVLSSDATLADFLLQV